MANLLRSIPSVDRLLNEPSIREMSKGLSLLETTEIVRTFLNQLRTQLIQSPAKVDYEQVVSQLADEIRRLQLQKFQSVINATGVLIHTNLGRAPLPTSALQRLKELGNGYFNLELDLTTGTRGSRYANAARLLNVLSASDNPSETDTVVVNNNAAAVLVVLKALTEGKEVIVSRGELVEIGGGFRIPEVMAASGCLLKEVGTTNRTRLSDYRNAITPNTAAILRVHPSNYHIVGFTESVSRQSLAQLCKEHDLLLIEDVGSGAFYPFDEPLVSTALKHSSIVTYSGDKLLGGPQAGIISGRADLISIIKKDPLLRAIRIDKLSLIVLEEVLQLYLRKEYDRLPLWVMATIPLDKIRQRAETWLDHLGPGLIGEVKPTQSTMGGGSLPGETIPSWALVIHSEQLTPSQLEERLRSADPPMMGRIHQDRVWLDPRTVLPEQDKLVQRILAQGVTVCS